MAAKKVIMEFEARVKDLQRDLQRIENELEQIQGEQKKTDKGFMNMNDGGKKLLGTFKNLAAAAGVAFGVNEIVRFTREVVTLAGKAEGVQRAFERIAEPGYLDELRAATRGTVSDLQLMQQAVRARNFDIPLTQLASLFDFARRRAKETGEEVDYLVESIILGIGRKSPLILDNLGISAVRLRQELKGVSAESATVGDVAEVVGRIATQAMADMGEEAETAADKQQRLSATFQNMKVEIGRELIPVANKFYEVMIDALGFIDQYYLGDNINQAKQEANAARGTINAVENYIASLADSEEKQKEIKATREALIAVMGEESRAFVMGMSDREVAYRQELQALENRFNKMFKYGNQEVDYLSKTDLTYERMLASIKAITQAIQQMETERLKVLNEALGDKNTLKAMQDQIKALNELFMTTEIGTEQYYKYKQQLEQVRAEYDRLTKGDQDRAKALEEHRKFLEQVMADYQKLPQIISFDIPELQLAELFKKQADQINASYDEMQAKREEDAGNELAYLQQRLMMGQEFYNTYGLTQEEFTAKMIKLTMYRAKALLDEQAITQEQYDQIIAMQQKLLEQSQTNAFDVSMALVGGLSAISGAMVDLFSKVNDAQSQSGNFAKTMALFNLSVQTAEAIGAAISAAFKNPTNLTLPQQIAQVAASTALVLSNINRARQILANEPPQPPQFEQGGMVGGQLHSSGGTMIEAERGEYVINRKMTAKYKDAVTAINKGYFDKYVLKHYVAPLQAALAQPQQSFADNIAESIMEQQSRYLKKISRGVMVTNIRDIAKHMQGPNINRFKA